MRHIITAMVLVVTTSIAVAGDNICRYCGHGPCSTNRNRSSCHECGGSFWSDHDHPGGWVPLELGLRLTRTHQGLRVTSFTWGKDYINSERIQPGDTITRVKLPGGWEWSKIMKVRSISDINRAKSIAAEHDVYYLDAEIRDINGFVKYRNLRFLDNRGGVPTVQVAAQKY